MMYGVCHEVHRLQHVASSALQLYWYMPVLYHTTVCIYTVGLLLCAALYGTVLHSALLCVWIKNGLQKVFKMFIICTDTCLEMLSPLVNCSVDIVFRHMSV